MKQSDKPTIAWAVVREWGDRPRVGEIIGRTPKGFWLRSVGWRNGGRGDFHRDIDVIAEFATKTEAEAAINRYNETWDSFKPLIDKARDDVNQASRAQSEVLRSRRESALAAMTRTGDQG